MPTAETARNVTVVGAGIVGVACALSLQREGHRVTIVDRLDPGEATSAGNAGVLSAASCVPMSMPGTLRSVPKWLRDPLGPLAVRWGYLPRALPWLLRFVRAGTPEQVERQSIALDALHATTVEHYRRLARAAGAEHYIKDSGYLFVYESEAAFARDQAGFDLRRARGIRLEILRDGEIRAVEPELAPYYRRAVLMPNHGFTTDPKALTKALAAHFARSGGAIVKSEVRDIEIGPDGPRRLLTEAGDLPLEVLVVAAGAWSGRLAARLGSRVPLESQRGYHVTIADPGITLGNPIMSDEGKFVATSMEMGLRLAGTVEFAGLTAAPNMARAQQLLAQARRMFPRLDFRHHTEWMGHRPSLPDSLPVIGPSPRFRDVYFAFGHSHTGLTAAPITGRLMADLVGGRAPQIDIAPFRIDRF